MRPVDTGSLLTPCVFEKWLRFDLWELRQSAFILSGYEPPELADLEPFPADPYALYHHPAGWADYLAGTLDRRADPSFKIAVKELRTLISAMELAVNSGVLLAEQYFADGGYAPYVKPDAAVRWAKAKGYPIPLELESIAEAVAPIPADSNDRPEYNTTDLLSVIGRLLLLVKDQQKEFASGGGRINRKYVRGGQVTVKAVADDLEELSTAVGLITDGCGDRKTRGILTAAIKLVSENTN